MQTAVPRMTSLPSPSGPPSPPLLPAHMNSSTLLQYDNVMVEGDAVSGLLDFEFWWVGGGRAQRPPQGARRQRRPIDCWPVTHGLSGTLSLPGLPARSAYDWRIMELAVALSKYVSEDDPLPLIREFVRCGAQNAGGETAVSPGGGRTATLSSLSMDAAWWMPAWSAWR